MAFSDREGRVHPVRRMLRRIANWRGTWRQKLLLCGLIPVLMLPLLTWVPTARYEESLSVSQRNLARRFCQDPTDVAWYACTSGARKLLSAIPMDRKPPAAGIYDGLLDPGHPDLRLGGETDGLLALAIGRSLRMGHGLSVSGLIGAGARDGGMKGMAPGAPLIGFSRTRDTPSRSIDDALAYFVSRGLRVAAFPVLGPADAAVVTTSVEADLLPVGSFPNVEGKFTDVLPASLPGFLAVTALGPDGLPLPLGHGPAADLAVPAPDLPGPVPFLRLGPVALGSPYGSGICCDSSAVAVATGAATLLAWFDLALTGPQIHKRLLISARDIGTTGWDERTGHGALDLEAAATLDRIGPTISFRVQDSGVRGEARDDVLAIPGNRDRDEKLQPIPTSAVSQIEVSWSGPEGPWEPIPFEIAGGSALDNTSYRALFDMPAGSRWARARDSAGNWGEPVPCP